VRDRHTDTYTDRHNRHTTTANTRAYTGHSRVGKNGDMKYLASEIKIQAY